MLYIRSIPQVRLQQDQVEIVEIVVEITKKANVQPKENSALDVTNGTISAMGAEVPQTQISHIHHQSHMQVHTESNILRIKEYIIVKFNRKVTIILS